MMASITRHASRATAASLVRTPLRRESCHVTSLLGRVHRFSDSYGLKGIEGDSSSRWAGLAALTQDPMIENISEQIRQQHEINRQQPAHKNLDDIAMDQRAIVVTEASSPFRIVDVNKAWENLCGYSREQAKGKRLGELLHGPETEYAISQNLVEKILSGSRYSEAILTNYTRQGRKFQNRVSLGHFETDEGESYLMGFLEEVPSGEEKKTHFLAGAEKNRNDHIQSTPHQLPSSLFGYDQ